MPSKKTQGEKAAPAAEAPKPAAKTKQEPALSLDRQQVIAALNAGSEA